MYHSTVKYKKGYDYILVESRVYKTSVQPDYTVHTSYVSLFPNGDLHIKEGYAWDGASGAFDTDTNMRASLIHDALVQLVQEGKLGREYKADIDHEYYSTCRRDGMALLRALSHLLAIQVHDWTKTQQKTYEAPSRPPQGKDNDEAQ